MPARTQKPPVLNIPFELAKIFDQAQANTSNHHKNVVALYKLQLEAAKDVETIKKGQALRLVGERSFEDAFLQMLIRVLPLKKGTSQADRIIKFVGTFIKFINEKAIEDKAVSGDDSDDDDTPASRFTARLLKFLLKGFPSKDKSARYRVVFSVAEMVSHLGEVDEDIYKELKDALLDRAHDREAFVRVQAFIGLSKLAGSEDEDEVEGEQAVLDVLRDSLAHDASSDVRRAILMNIPILESTLSDILDRIRDVDVIIRKLVISGVLEKNITRGEEEEAGPTHPKLFSLVQCEHIVKYGLGDREPAVKAATHSLLSAWFDAASETLATLENGDEVKVEEEEGRDALINNVLSFLAFFDLEEGKIASDALHSIFATRADIFNEIKFQDRYWSSLTPETAFLARVFVDYCEATNDDARLEAVLPVVTALAFRIQEAYNRLLESVQAYEEERVVRVFDEPEHLDYEDQRLNQEFVIGEMLALAVNLDYSDEIGRRKMFQLVRDMLSQESLPEVLLAKCLDVLRKLSSTERDLIRVVVEIIQDLREPPAGEEEEVPPVDADGDTSFQETPTTARPTRAPIFRQAAVEKTPEEKARADEIDLRCLTLCIGMLERVNSKWEENSTLDGILAELIIPSIQRKELIFREKGFISMGLCCLIARRLALRYMDNILQQIASAPEVLKLSIIQLVFDILMVHKDDFLREKGTSADDAASPQGEWVNRLLGMLERGTSPKVQALVCLGMSKLVLAGLFTNIKAIQNLIQLYFLPETAQNQELRQCLAFFLPVYAYSSQSNQKVIKDLFVACFNELKRIRGELGEDEEMVSTTQICMLFLDWTDPVKLAKAATAGGKTADDDASDDCIQVDFACDILHALMQDKFEKEDKRVICQLLGRLYIPDSMDDNKVRRLLTYVLNLRARRPLKDTLTNNAFTKFENVVTKKFEKQLQDFDETELRKLKELEELFKFLDSIIPEDDGELVDIDVPKRKGKKRRSESIATTSSGNDTETQRLVKPAKSKQTTKKRRLSTSDDESDEEQAPPSRSEPSRQLPKRAAALKKPPSLQIIEISSDSDEDPTPLPRRSRPRAKPAQAQVKKELDPEAEIDNILPDESNASYDSIMDGDSDEEEEHEVNGLLAD